MIGSAQSEHTAIHEKNIALMYENTQLKQTIVSLKEKVITLQQEAMASKNQPIPPKDKLSDEAEKILLFLTEYRDVTSKQVAHFTKLDFTRTDYWLKELARGNMIIAALSIRSPTTYSIGESGREYLINNNMI
jgi:hypothetical protein